MLTAASSATVVARTVATFVLAAVVATACNDSAPPTAAPVARPADVVGILAPASPTDAPRADGTIGPTRIRVGDAVYDLPTDRSLDDPACGYVRVPDNQIGMRECWAQVGIADDGRTVEWVESSFSAPDGGGPAVVTAQGVVALIDEQQVVLTEGTTIPLGPAFIWICPTATEGLLRPSVGDRVLVDIDTADGTAVEASCGPGEA